MQRKIKIIYHVFLYAVLLNVCDIAISQTKSIKGAINDYARVIAINGNAVTLSDASMFIPANLPDTVLLIQMTGIEVTDKSNDDIKNAGIYEFHIIESINGQTVTIKRSITPNTFSPPGDELIQMIRVPSYKNAQIDGTLTCEPWNWEEGTGGVLALMVNETLTFNGSIDVSGKGFKGGKPSGEEYTGGCIVPNDDDYNVDESSKIAGYKGEGAITKRIIDETPKGWGRAWNGGGGGDGKWSGGGGGTNAGRGGPGDVQACLGTTFGYGTDPLSFGNAGHNIKYSEENDSVFWSKRAFMGGGGGSGTGKDATYGGNGGGIVMIVAKKLNFSPNTKIKANGDSVEGVVETGGAGGGGGGGSIFLSAEDYGGINAEAKGGNGGNIFKRDCNDDTFTRGAGGGGGGGLVFTTRDTSQFTAWYRNSFFVNSGELGDIQIMVTPPGCWAYGGPGTKGLFLGNFQVQLRGFLHNYIFVSDTVFVCHNEKETIRASKPKGGIRPYNYAWQYSTDDGHSWKNPGSGASPIVGNSTQLDGIFQFVSQSDTFKLRRVVTSVVGTANEIIDSSEPITVVVRPPVNNQIIPTETVCWTETFVLKGNDLSRNYQWEEELDGEWKNLPGVNTGGNLSIEWPYSDTKQTHRFRRIATSFFGCKDTSSISTIHVFPEITNNTIITGDQNVCEDDELESLIGSEPAGGIFPDYHYQWQFMTDDTQWRDIPKNSEKQDCDLSIIKSIIGTDYDKEYHFHRIVTSGISGVKICESTSGAVRLKIDKKPSDPQIIKPDTDLTGDKILIFSLKRDIEAKEPTIGSGRWSSPDQLIFEPPDQPKTTVSNLQKGENIIRWTVSNGVCADSSTTRKIEVKILSTIGFSPNEDGKNECLRIPAVKDDNKCELIIFDRYNNIVFKGSFERESDDCVWDGKDKHGNEFPTGTYFYQLTIYGNKVYKGYVVLKK